MALHQQKLVPEEALVAASTWVRFHERMNDDTVDGTPVWFGWALHAAFVAGVLWRQMQPPEDP